MIIFSNIKSILLIIFFGLITSCSSNQSMKPQDFKDKKPRLIIENYLSGSVKAWGVLQNRSGKVTRQFSADLNGKWDGKQLVLCLLYTSPSPRDAIPSRMPSSA